MGNSLLLVFDELQKFERATKDRWHEDFSKKSNFLRNSVSAFTTHSGVDGWIILNICVFDTNCHDFQRRIESIFILPKLKEWCFFVVYWRESDPVMIWSLQKLLTNFELMSIENFKLLGNNVQFTLLLGCWDGIWSALMRCVFIFA